MALTAHMVTIDCADPAALSRFWTEATSYPVADADEGGAVLAAVLAAGVDRDEFCVPEQG